MEHPQADVIDTYWARRFGCSLEEFRQPGVQVIVSDQADPSRIAVLEFEHTTIVRIAFEHHEALANWSNTCPSEAPRSAQAVADALGHEAWRISPSEKAFYLNQDRFRPFDRFDVRQLTAADSGALTAMHRGCSLEEQQAGEVNIDHPAIFGAFADDQLVASASLIDQGAQISDVGVLVHRDFRRKGFGRAVVSAVSQWGLENDRIVQYWRLCSNSGSARIADALGFTEYGRYQVLHRKVSPFF